MVIQCPNCGRKNRVPAAATGGPRCGHCKAALPWVAAAVCGASEGPSTIVLDAVAAGGQAGASSRIENYLGFPAGISGAELADRALIQATEFGATISVPVEAAGLEQSDGHYAVRLDDGPRLHSRTVAVVVGGTCAGRATVYLAQHASRVYLLVRHDDLAPTCPATWSTSSGGIRAWRSYATPTAPARRRWATSAADRSNGRISGRRGLHGRPSRPRAPRLDRTLRRSVAPKPPM